MLFSTFVSTLWPALRFNFVLQSPSTIPPANSGFDHVDLCPSLLNHVNVIDGCNGSSCGSGSSALCFGHIHGFCLGIGRCCRTATTSPIVIHLCVEFFSRLPRPAIDQFMSTLISARTAFSSLPQSSPTSKTGAAPIALAGHVTVNVLRRWFRHITPPLSWWWRASPGTTASRSRPLLVGIRHGTVTPPSTASTGRLDPVEETSRILHSVEWVVSSRQGKKSQSDWLAFGVGSVELADGSPGVGHMSIRDECNALGSPSSIIAEFCFHDWSNSCEEVLARSIPMNGESE